MPPAIYCGAVQRRIGVVGGGIVGLAVARELAARFPSAQVIVFEKEAGIARHQTGHNSGVVHAGLYYRPGSLKARLCTRGRSMLREFCSDRGLPYDARGKLVLAVDPDELNRFDALEVTARENGVPGLRRIDSTGIREIEPHARGLVGLHSPETAITDFVAIAEAIAADIRAAGGEIRLGAEVVGIQQNVAGVTVTTRAGTERLDRLISCGGLHSDRLGRLAGESAEPAIVPFRGEYLQVLPAKQDLVRGLIYPVPDPRYPFLGVHFTRRISGALDVGPNAVLGLGREGYRRSDVDLGDLREIVRWPGTWRLARQHWRTGARELAGSASIRLFLRSAQRYVPEIGVADVVRGGAGVRAQAVNRDGSLVDDFVIRDDDRVTTIRNAPSPAATSSLAIAEYVADHVQGVSRG